MRGALVCVLLLGLGCSRPEKRVAEQPVAVKAGDRPRKTPSRSESDSAEGAGKTSVAVVVGAIAPPFRAKTKSGQDTSLDALRGKIVILYFYPKDGTPGCTTEAQNFALIYKELTKAGAELFGVSTDDPGSHSEFAEDLGLPFPLIADEGGALGRAYGVSTLFGMQERKSFLIDREGRVAKVYPNVDPAKHAEQVLADVLELGRAAAGPSR